MDEVQDSLNFVTRVRVTYHGPCPRHELFTVIIHYCYYEERRETSNVDVRLGPPSSHLIVQRFLSTNR